MELLSMLRSFVHVVIFLLNLFMLALSVPLTSVEVVFFISFGWGCYFILFCSIFICWEIQLYSLLLRLPVFPLMFSCMLYVSILLRLSVKFSYVKIVCYILFLLLSSVESVCSFRFNWVCLFYYLLFLLSISVIFSVLSLFVLISSVYTVCSFQFC